MVTIINKSSAIDLKKQVFDPEIRKHYEDGYKSKEHVLNGGSVAAGGSGGQYKPLERIQDPQEMRKQMVIEKQHAEKGAPIKLTPQQKDELWNKAKALKAKICEGLISKHELHPVKTLSITKNGEKTVATVVDNDAMNKSKVVERNKEWYKKNEGNLREFRRVVRLLDPDAKIDGLVDKWRLA